MPDLLATVLPSLVSLVGGFALGWFSHQLSGRRDRQNREYNSAVARAARKHEFLKFMGQWRYEVEHSSPEITLISEFRAKLHLFRAATAAIDDDFPIDQWPDFASLCLSLYDVEEKLQSNYTQNTREVMSDAIGSVIRFVENT